MNTIEKRDYIHNYLYRLDEKEIDKMFKKVKSQVEKEITLSDTQEEEIEKRVKRHKTGESKSYSWTDVKRRVRTKI